jgi:alkylhydroperoxidase family enzyme
MARIDYCDTSKSNERTREILGKNRNANIFRMMAHSPSYFEQYCRLGGAIRHRGELDPVVRELAITRTGILCEAPYEIVAHKRIGKNVGVTDEQNAALEDWESATCFNELQRAALAFTDEIVAAPPDRRDVQRHRGQADAGGAGRTAALGRLLHHDVEVPGNLRHRHAAGDGSGWVAKLTGT